MDIFNRKKLAEAEAEIRKLKEYNHQQYSEQQAMLDKLRIAENEVRKYIQKHDADKKIIGKLKQGNEELKWELKESEAVISAFLEQSGNIDAVEDNSRTKNAAGYVIRNELIEGKIDVNKKIRSKFVAALYKSRKSFFSSNELKFYEILSDLSQKKGFILFSKVRLADIIEMWEKFYDEESMEKANKQSPYEQGTAFLNALNKNPFKKQVYDRIQKLNPDFDDRDYQAAFLYPLLRLHFLTIFRWCAKVVILNNHF